MTRYRLLTTWLLDAPVDRVWDVLYDAERRPAWWRGVVRTDVLSDGLWRSTWRSFLPYELTFELETFAWNHHWVMRCGAEGLARELGCELVGAS
jgi:uncharacterized protein YndB with AHSA1/START domain